MSIIKKDTFLVLDDWLFGKNLKLRHYHY